MKCAFIVYQNKKENLNLFATTTRRYNGIGFPDGKLEDIDNNCLRNCCIREAKEEGWFFEYVDKEPFYNEIIDSKYIVYYFKAYGNYKQLSDYIEKDSIKNIFSHYNDVIKYFNNKIVLDKFFETF